MIKIVKKMHQLALASCAAWMIAGAASAAPITMANVMAPLHITNEVDWSNFDNQLIQAKNIGVTGVSVDVWWGLVERNGDQQFNWTYYDRMFNAITSRGLKIVPIMSFHQCGGNVGDTCNGPDANGAIHIPAWIWSGLGGNANDHKYKSEQGNFSNEYVSLWSDNLVMNQYQQFLTAFLNRYASRASQIAEINISAGPAGELRYPSYNQHDVGTGYPTRGAFQAYGARAIADFQIWAQNKYGGLAGLRNAWGLPSLTVAQILPPSDANFFINSGNQFNTQYGRDFIQWYHQSLKDHGRRKLTMANTAMSSPIWSNTPVGMKLPGIHWKAGAPDNTNRSAELATGLLRTDTNALNDPNRGHGYDSMVGLWAEPAFKNHPTRKFILHFTAVEMDNQNWAPQYSLAKDLVFWVAAEAQRQGVTIMSENALSGGVQTHTGWNNINNAFTYSSYTGLTVLRISDVIWSALGKDRYQQFISQFYVPPVVGNTAKITFVVNGATTTYGQNIFVVGSDTVLGAWNTAQAKPMTASNCSGTVCTWTSNAIDLPANTSVQYKLIRKNADGSVNWENGGNKSGSTGSAGSVNTWSSNWQY